LNWDIAKGYYLYKKKIKIVSDHSQRLGEAQFPAAKIKDDEFFGKVGIYLDNTLNALSISDLLPLTTLSVADLVIGG
jgi:thiol:disulfide interchange protein DsbD